MNVDTVILKPAAPVVERPHHPFSPSKLQYLEVSPLYSSRQSDSVASKRGTAQHDAAEDEIHIDDPSLEDHEFEAVLRCKEYRESIIAKYPGGTVIKEEYLPIDNVLLTFKGKEYLGTSAGYLDLAVVSADGTAADIVDWKFGMWSVEPTENNLQGMAYLLGLLKRYPMLQSVTVHFVMPHREEIDVHTFHATEFEAMYLRICVIVARAKEAQEHNDYSKCQVMAPCCLFCGNLGSCTKVADTALRIGKKYHPIMVPEHVSPTTINKVEHASETMVVAQLMEAWGKAIRAQMTARVIEDENWTPEGYVLRSRANREVADEAKLKEVVLKHGITAEQFEASKKITMTPLNKLVRDQAGRGQKVAAEEQFRDDLINAGALVEEPPTIFLERLKS